jgi:long-subunit acyl-CoA synthetase (AMP-forming)
MTSGTTGTPKAVRLSARNVLSNADAITLALGIRPEDRAVASLPLHHSYGLSVLNSHLRSGACTVLTRDPPMTDAFWRSVLRHSVTSLAGVPLMYEGWWRTLGRLWPGSLRTATQAGGALRPELALAYAESARRFFTMYGQTEATARMSCLDLTSAPQHAGSVGTAIPGGGFTLTKSTEDGVGQVVYAGPNVMMGYACTREDLAGGDLMGGVLETGDVGTLQDGVLRLVGRTARFTKVAGRRISLDEFEEALGLGPTAVAVEHVGRIVLFRAGGWCEADHGRAERVALGFGVPSACIVLRSVDRIPTTAAQKADYARLADLARRATVIPPITGVR